MPRYLKRTDAANYLTQAGIASSKTTLARPSRRRKQKCDDGHYTGH